jgi:ppGpp synthetase/RelA/SpoT-type nucleotidyltranferase
MENALRSDSLEPRQSVLSGLPSRESEWLKLMPDSNLDFSVNTVKRAGKFLRDNDSVNPDNELDFVDALMIFDNWQACHSFPLKEFYESLALITRECDGTEPIVVQRRKRFSSVIAKLRNNPQMQLTTMQDLAGCRAIMFGSEDLRSVTQRCKEEWATHTLRETYDYVSNPKLSGYRGIHLVYSFRSDNPAFNGRLVEVQLRTWFQHAWATAVEIVDLFQKQSLKAGRGNVRWQRFFALMSCVVAMLEMSSPPVPETPLDFDDLLAELDALAEELHVEEQLSLYTTMTESIQRRFTGMSGYSGYSGNSGYFVMELDAKLNLEIRGYSSGEPQKAYKDVADAEQKNSNVVLVAASDLETLKTAYPNWTLNTGGLISLLKTARGMADSSRRNKP